MNIVFNLYDLKAYREYLLKNIKRFSYRSFKTEYHGVVKVYTAIMTDESEIITKKDSNGIFCFYKVGTTKTKLSKDYYSFIKECYKIQKMKEISSQKDMPM